MKTINQNPNLVNETQFQPQIAKTSQIKHYYVTLKAINRIHIFRNHL